MKEDLINRQAAIDTIDKYIAGFDAMDANFLDGLKTAKQLIKDINAPTKDTISRQAALNAMDTWDKFGRDPDGKLVRYDEDNHYVPYVRYDDMVHVIKHLPSVQPTLHGYNIEHLDLIARVLQKENLPPERITEMLTDIGRIVAIVSDEFEKSLRKAVEQCVT